MKLTGKQFEQIANEIKSTQIDVKAINDLAIGETCVAFKGVDGNYQAFFKTDTQELVSLLLVSRCGVDRTHESHVKVGA